MLNSLELKSKRLEYNIKCALSIPYIEGLDFHILMLYFKKYPNQRFGQIICNYICPDYRSNPSDKTKEIMETIFPGNPDPFYEEPWITLKRFANI